MYKIIGADGQPYGPVTVQQMRQWIAENRVRAETLVQAEGSGEWKPLTYFPELAAEIKTSPPPITPAPAVPPLISNPRASDKIPAGVCGIILGGLGVHKFILGYTGAGITMLLLTVLSCGALYPIMHLIGLIEGILYLAKSDDEFVRTYVDGHKSWF
ncbi:MAG TPA: GYF domain-containing protein [Verrucomicrobiae bacterium]|jgi:TM2 domain-containing membrane protein YozV|nr:GYF domain-containing protein [Verrucomicrobiae bacterium]